MRVNRERLETDTVVVLGKTYTVSKGHTIDWFDKERRAIVKIPAWFERINGEIFRVTEKSDRTEFTYLARGLCWFNEEDAALHATSYAPRRRVRDAFGSSFKRFRDYVVKTYEDAEQDRIVEAVDAMLSRVADPAEKQERLTQIIEVIEDHPDWFEAKGVKS